MEHEFDNLMKLSELTNQQIEHGFQLISLKQNFIMRFLSLLGKSLPGLDLETLTEMSNQLESDLKAQHDKFNEYLAEFKQSL